MRAVVIGNGDIKDYDYIRTKICSGDFIVCADGGYRHAKKLGLEPDILIGDFDSAGDVDEEAVKIEYPIRKDFTDGELAVRYAVEKGYKEIVMLAMTGDRFDHTLTDVLLLSLCENGVIIDDNNEIYMLRNTVKIKGRRGQTLSIIPVNGDVEGVSTKGLEYPLKNETLYFGASRGVSNVMLENECEIALRRGLALIVKVERV